MKKITKMIAAAMAALTIGAVMAAPASAAQYVDYYGNVWYDGIIDGKRYEQDIYGTYHEICYIGYDYSYGYIYYRDDIGYYANNSGVITYLGWNFVINSYNPYNPYIHILY